jgi:very-short-patch-repair endonuclease
MLPIELQDKCYFAELNKEFAKFNHNLNRGYFYDFVVSSIKLCIEFDGTYWHSREGSIERDKEKQEFLENLGFVLIRIKEEDYNSDKNRVINYCIDQIISFKKV